MQAGVAPTGDTPALHGVRQGRILLAFLLSIALHALLLGSATWKSGDLKRSGGELMIEARLITPDAPDMTAPPTSVPMRAEPPAPAKPMEPLIEVAPPTPLPARPPVMTVPTGTQAVLAEPVPAPTPAPPPAVAAGREAGKTEAPAATRTAEQQFDLEPAPDYYPAGLLSPPPRILEAGEPAYPPELKGVEGIVVLRILIGADGKLQALQVARSSPPGVFDASALNAFAAARFAPGYLAGVPVKSQMILEVKYTPINRGAKVSGSTYR